LVEAQARITDQLSVLTARIDALAEAQLRTEARLDTLVEAYGRIEGRLKGVEDRLDGLTGKVFELQYAQRAPAYLSPLARRLRVLDPGRLADLLDDAVEAGQLTESERAAVLATDLVLTGVRRENQTDVYLLVEVSAGIGPYDVERAYERARFLEKLGRPVVPVVAGERIDPETEARARAAGVWPVLDGHAVPPAHS
jgi:hypothetical protein